ncbi:MAG: lipid IV(A) 3-deoxy-D-manno-octulosonic acid transferase [Pseudomonadota bacterium]
MEAPIALRCWRGLYAVLLLLARPWVHLRLKLRARRDPEYGRRIEERFGHLDPDLPKGAVWFHTVSAGETIAAAPIIARLAETFPEQPVLVTTMTPTGSAQVQARLMEPLDNRIAHVYAPYDFPDALRRFFSALEPCLLVLMETELWPNMLRLASERQVPALLVNARLSERSARGYGRIGPLTADMLARLKFIACQYPDHAERFLALGAPADRVGALGSVKFDVELPPDHEARVAALRQDWAIGDRPVWIAGSTHAGEETVVLEAHGMLKAQFPEALLVLAPRHPERRDAVAQLIDEAGFSQGRLSHGDAVPGVDVLLADTMGELLYLYGFSQVAFLGGSLVSVGGHNPIEAAICAQPLVMGPETFNFPDVVAAFSDAGCLTLVQDARSLADVIAGHLGDQALREELGRKAEQVVARNRGATARLEKLLSAELQALGARHTPPPDSKRA